MTDPITHIAADGAAPNLAIDVAPDTAGGAFVFDVSEWDGPDLLAWGDDEAGWVNVVCDVTSVKIRRGATRLQGVLTRTEAGTCTLQVRDTERRFDPMVNADAIHPETPMRVRAWGEGWSEVLFTGTVDDIRVAYAKTGPPTITMIAADAVAGLAGWTSEGRPDPGVGDGDDLLERVTRVLDEMGRTGALATDVDTIYEAELAATNLSDAWGDVSAAVDAELGRLWVDRFNKLVLRARDSELSGTLLGTLSDIHDEIAGGTVHCCYDDAAVAYDTELVTNRAIGARRVPTTDPASPASALVQVEDEFSQARYGVRSVERRSLELSTDGQLQPWGEALLLRATEPELRVDGVSVAPARAPEAWQQVAATDIGDRWAFRLRPELGPEVARTLGVLGIEHDITPQRWACEWLTTEAPTPGETNPGGWFAWGVSDWDSDDLFAPFGGAVPA